MAPSRSPPPNLKSYAKSLRTWCSRTLSPAQLWRLASDTRIPLFVTFLYLLLEAVVNVLVIHRVPYTEIDWRAYMQEVEGVINGTLDYSNLKGDTGPLVYPAGFVYVYSAFYFLTSQGTNVRLAQYIFAAFHIILLFLVFRIYSKTRKVPLYALVLICCTSYRIHSIFVLRLFNDPVAMILLYASLNAFMDGRWHLGSLLYSLAVSIKMNVLLFAPALLVAYLTNLDLSQAILQLLICASVQFLLGLPFLYTNPLAYLKGAFNLGRVFEFKWTVNWRFLPEETFVSPYFHLALLGLHLLFLGYFARQWILYLKSYARLKFVGKDVQKQLKGGKETVDMSTLEQLFILPMFMSNFIGIMVSRSLHYQFYVWYYHTLPYLAWCTDYKVVTKFVLLGIIEMCWNTYPSTIFSSLSLHLCHGALLFGLYRSKIRGEKGRLNKS